MLRLSLLACLLLTTPASAQPPKILFDFEDPADLKAWSNLPDPKRKEPPAKFELSTDYATSGKHSLKITFAGGNWPTILSTTVPDDWSKFQSFAADVTVSRPCLVGFCILQEKSKRGGDWDGAVSRWVKTQLLQPGQTTMAASLQPTDYMSIHPKLGKVVSLEIFIYNPRDGESIHVDNIRISTAKLPATTPPKTQFQVLGTDHVVTGVQELSKKLADKWTKPEPQTIEQIERQFTTRFDEIKKTHPKATLAIFRDGNKDPANPDKTYAGWKDAYWSSHGPDGMTVERATNFGKSATQEIFMRHRSPLFRVDVSSIPKGANILAAQLAITRASDPAKEHSPLKPNMWVAEACNRPWEENEVNAYQFAKDKYWKAVGGMHWTDDADFLPIYLAHGPSQPGVCTWDFTHAVRFWTDGKQANHGFMLHGDSKDWFRAYYREAPEVKHRPALLVIYEAK